MQRALMYALAAGAVVSAQSDSTCSRWAFSGGSCYPYEPRLEVVDCNGDCSRAVCCDLTTTAPLTTAAHTTCLAWAGAGGSCYPFAGRADFVQAECGGECSREECCNFDATAPPGPAATCGAWAAAGGSCYPYGLHSGTVECGGACSREECCDLTTAVPDTPEPTKVTCALWAGRGGSCYPFDPRDGATVCGASDSDCSRSVCCVMSGSTQAPTTSPPAGTTEGTTSTDSGMESTATTLVGDTTTEEATTTTTQVGDTTTTTTTEETTTTQVGDTTTTTTEETTTTQVGDTTTTTTEETTTTQVGDTTTTTTTEETTTTQVGDTTTTTTEETTMTQVGDTTTTTEETTTATEDMSMSALHCSTDADCRTQGDAAATCTRRGAVQACSCSDGFVHPMDFDGLCAKADADLADMALPTTVTLRWPDADCSKYDAAAEAQMRAAIEAATGIVFADYASKCGSLTVAATVQSPLADVAKMAARMGAAGVAQAVHRHVAAHAADLPLVTQFGEPTGDLVFGSGRCTRDGATATFTDTAGQCHALSCRAGYVVSESEGVSLCGAASTTSEPAAPGAVRAAAPAHSDDDDGLGAKEIVGIVAGGVVLAILVAALVFWRCGAAQPKEPKQNLPTEPVDSVV